MTTRSRKDSKARRIDWGNEKELIGDGPGCLLFCREDVLDLRTGSATKSAPELKKILKGFQALDAKTGEIYWLAYDLSRIYGGDNFGGFNESKNNVLEAISQIMTAEKGELQKATRRFSTLLKAGWTLRQWAKLDVGTIRFERSICKLWIVAKDGNPMSVTDYDYGENGRPGSLLSFREHEWDELVRSIGHKPTLNECRQHLQPVTFFVKTTATSDFARIAQERRDVPTKKELKEYLAVDEPTITRRCREAGFSWLPSELAGRKKSLQHRRRR
jgi:hypothetical protein